VSVVACSRGDRRVHDVATRRSSVIAEASDVASVHRTSFERHHARVNRGDTLLDATGIARISYDTVLFTTSGEKPTATSIVLQGVNASPAGVVFGQGVLCRERLRHKRSSCRLSADLAAAVELLHRRGSARNGCRVANWPGPVRCR
jgi:hypothetical protein